MSTRSRLALALGLPLLALGGLALAPRRLDLVVVNPGPTPALVSVRDGPPVEVAAGASVRLDGVRAGRVSLVARAPSGDELGRAEGDCPAGLLDPRRTWVWSVAPISSWWIVSKGYGDRVRDAPPPAPFTPPAPVFALPPELLPAVDEPLPGEAVVKKGETGAVRAALWSAAYVERAAPALVDLVVDNALPFRVRVEVNGVARGEVARGQTVKLEGLRPGRLELRAVGLAEGGEEGQAFDCATETEAAPLRPRPVYVWNIGGATNRYWVVAARYGATPEGQEPLPPLRTFVAPGELFRVPDGFLPGLNEPLPERWPDGVLELLWSEARLRESRRQTPVQVPDVPMQPR